MSVRSLFDSNAEAAALVSDDDYFIIDAVTRKITPPASFKNFGVESDEAANRIYFKCPRIVGDNIDLSAMTLRVNYRNANKEKDQYIVIDTVADGETVYFSWLLSRKCTKYTGLVDFIICAVRTDESGKIVKEWNTTLCSGLVLGGMEVDSPEIPEEITDIVAQLLDITNTAITDTQTAAAEAVRNVQEAEAAAITNINNGVDTALLSKGYANAIKGKLSGEIVVADDVSPVEHEINVKVKSKNLYNIKDYNIDDAGRYRINGNLLKFGKTYTVFSAQPMRFFKVSTSYTGFNCAARALDGGFNSFTFTLQILGDITEDSQLYIIINNLDSTAMFDYNTLESMQICIIEGENATEYVPYISPEKMTVRRCGKNLFNAGNFIKQIQTQNGITVEILENGAIWIKGTPENTSIETSLTFTTGKGYGKSLPLPPGKYIDNYTFNSKGDKLRCFPQAISSAGNWIVNLNGNPVEITETFYLDRFVVYLPAGTTDTINQFWYMQVECGNAVSEYVGYQKDTSHIPNIDGTVSGVLSLSPNLTIFTDTQGAIIECEYSKDLIKIIDALTQRIAALESGV